jgi:hypothetical protein
VERVYLFDAGIINSSLNELSLDHADLWDCRKLNESPSKVEEPAVLKLPLCTPKVKKITLHFPLGLEVVARNMKGVTIKDALDAIHKQFKKRVCSLFLFPDLSLGVTHSSHLVYTRLLQHANSDDRQMTSSRSHT